MPESRERGLTLPSHQWSVRDRGCVPVAKVLAVVVLLTSALVGTAAADITDPIAAPLPQQTQEPVTDVQQPDISRLPVFDTYFAPPTGLPFDGGYTSYGHPVAVAGGGGNVYVSSADARAVAEHDATTLAYKGALQDPGLRTPRGVAYYRGEVFVVDYDDAQVFVFDPTTRAVKRTFQLPIQYVTADGYTVLNDVRITGIDVAWGEAWISFLGSGGGGGIVVLDSTTGQLKSVNWHLPRYDCTSNPADLEFAHNACTDDATTPTSKGVVASCRTDIVRVDTKARDTSAVTVNTGQLNECSGAATRVDLNPDRFNWWDLATVPEYNGVLAQCRMINRGALATAPPTDDVTADDLLFDGDDCAHGQFQDGTDAVWGMRWFLAVSGDATGRAGTTVNEYRITQPTAGQGSRFLDGPVRSWSPMDAGDGNHRDIAYQTRETRIDWKGPLASTEWQHGNQCVDYIVSDADIYVVGQRGEHWFELARGFQKIDLLVDGTVRSTSTAPKGTFCFDGDSIPSGVHAVSLKAVVANGSKTVEARNDSYRVDHTPPDGTVSDPGHFVRGTVSLAGAMTDAHSGAADRQLEVQPNGGSWSSLCGLQSADDLGQTFPCTWDTTSGFPDGLYNLRGRMRDKVAAGYGGANAGYTPVVSTIVDNTPPGLTVAGQLRDRADLGPLEYGSPVSLDVAADDNLSGAVDATVLVDGIQEAQATQSCPSGGCPTLRLHYTLTPDDFTDGHHTVTVRAIDGIGNQSEDSWTVDVEETPPPSTPEEDAAIGDDDTAPADPSVDAAAFARVASPGDQVLSTSNHTILACTQPSDPANFGVYSLGQSFEGLGVTAVLRRCDLPFPGEPARANFVSYIYGDCTVPQTDEASCTPPLEVQSWPICERTLADYTLGPDQGSLEYQSLTMRGVPAAAFDGDNRVELYTGDSTIVIFGTDGNQVERAVSALTEEPSSDPPGMPRESLTVPGSMLPQPARGAVEGLVPCVS